MFQSFIISGGSEKESRNELLKFLPFSLSNTQLETLLKSTVSTHPDILSIVPKNSIGIEEIRNVEKIISLKPISLSHKIVIFNEAEKLTIEAQNALLKTLEEPPNYVFLFLLTKNLDLLLPTIISRCKTISLSSLNFPNSEEETINEDYKILVKILSVNLGKRIFFTDQILKSETSLSLWLDKIVYVWHQLLYQIIGLHSKKPSTLEQETPSLLSIKQIKIALKNTLKTKELVEKNINSKLALDHLFLSWPQLNN